MAGTAVGANIQNLSQGRLADYVTTVPDYDSQVRIAKWLSVYDNLIENNKKQIKLLEEAAERLYREWFVDFHFPGYEDAKIVDGVPDGWKKVGLSNIAPIITGKKDANFCASCSSFSYSLSVPSYPINSFSTAVNSVYRSPRISRSTFALAVMPFR